MRGNTNAQADTTIVTTGLGTVEGGCTLEAEHNPIRWCKKGNICTVIYAIRLPASYSSGYTQYIMATGLPGCVVGAYPYASQGLSVDGQSDSGGALAFVNTVGHLYILTRHQSMASKVVIGSVTYITA